MVKLIVNKREFEGRCCICETLTDPCYVCLKENGEYILICDTCLSNLQDEHIVEIEWIGEDE